MCTRETYVPINATYWIMYVMEYPNRRTYFTDAVMYKESQTLFKKTNHSTSQRTITSMDESATVMEQLLAMEQVPTENRRRLLDWSTECLLSTAKHGESIAKVKGHETRSCMSSNLK